MPSVYIETSVISYLTARPSRDVVVAGRQQVTHEWWHRHRGGYEVMTSRLVLQEASAGDPRAAAKRMKVLNTLPILGLTAEAVQLAKQLIEAGSLPFTAADDALHVAIAAAHGLDYLLTWN
jgi:predicted nucleic acid-binding protein